jgi:hypothetical protein
VAVPGEASDVVDEIVDAFLRKAIDEKRLISFTLDGRRRVAEPHDYGVVDGMLRLLFFQVAGESNSGRALGWRWASADKLTEIKLLDERFPGTRLAPSGRHRRWDRIIASVSKRA